MSHLRMTVVHSGRFSSLQKCSTISFKTTASSFGEASICGITSTRSE